MLTLFSVLALLTALALAAADVRVMRRARDTEREATTLRLQLVDEREAARHRRDEIAALLRHVADRDARLEALRKDVDRFQGSIVALTADVAGRDRLIDEMGDSVGKAIRLDSAWPSADAGGYA